MNIAFPWRFDGRGQTSRVDEATYIRGLIEQVLFTAPGERVMRPDFGSGLMQLVYAPNHPELAATVQVLAQGALQQWLGDLIALGAVEVETVDSVLRVHVTYTVNRTGAEYRENFERRIPAP